MLLHTFSFGTTPTETVLDKRFLLEPLHGERVGTDPSALKNSASKESDRGREGQGGRERERDGERGRGWCVWVALNLAIAQHSATTPIRHSARRTRLSAWRMMAPRCQRKAPQTGSVKMECILLTRGACSLCAFFFLFWIAFGGYVRAAGSHWTENAPDGRQQLKVRGQELVDMFFAYGGSAPASTIYTLFHPTLLTCPKNTRAPPSDSQHPLLFCHVTSHASARHFPAPMGTTSLFAGHQEMTHNQTRRGKIERGVIDQS